MPSIKPISGNGHGAYTIMSIAEADELDRLRAMFRLLSDLRTAEEEADRNGWIDAVDLEKEMGIYD